MGCGSCGNKDNCIFVNSNDKHDCRHGAENGHVHSHAEGCLNEGHHHHDEIGGKGLVLRLLKICITLFLFIVLVVLDTIFNLASVNPGPANWVLPFVCYFVVYLILGLEIIREAFKGIAKGEFLDENFLMMVASFGAFALGIYKGCIAEQPDGFAEGCAIVIFYSIGEFFQSWAVGRSRKSISELMGIRAEYARIIIDSKEEKCQDSALLESTEVINVEGCNYSVRTVKPEEAEIGEILVIKQGEKVPVDGILLDRNAYFDTMALTGESEYEKVNEGSEVLSGSIYMDAEPIRIHVTKEYENSTVAKILNLVETASERKTKAEKFITHFARIYTPIVVGLAVLIAIIPPVIGLVSGGYINTDLTWTTWIYRALSFLVVSCPCALVISVPLSFTMGITTAGKYHILVKGSNFLELIPKVKTIVSDKTGTLTVGRDIKAEAKGVVDWIKENNMRLYLLSGDKKEIVADVARKLGIENYEYELKPQDKFVKLEEIINSKEEKEAIAFLGDGINDAPSLMRADVGISMGGVGSDAAVEASDIVFMKDDLNGILILRKIAKRTMAIVTENVVFSIGIKVLVLVLTVLGISGMWVAVFADVGVCVLAVLNALRVGMYRYNDNSR